jgi:predicted phosphate transport protein (TIGR00153 family)
LRLGSWLVPQDKIFFDLLDEESANVAEGARKLEEMITRFDNLDERRSEIREIEHHGDEIVHQIYERVNSAFITPIDQDDITKLASLYDDVLDFIEAVANRIVLYELKEATDPMREMAKIVGKSVMEIHAAFVAMRNNDGKEIDKRCIAVDTLENEADMVLNDGVAYLFKGSDVIQIMKLKEIYEELEIVTDKCEDVSQELRDIVRRYS